jgi:Fur family ferric uptake transcriptional regulator
MERNTRQRSAIRDAIARAERPLLPQEVLDAAQEDVPGIGIATVYRNLKALVDEGELQAVNLPGENPRFEVMGHRHHHHFQCRQCQRVFDVHACPGDLSHLAPQGFTVEDHDLTLYGRCRDCAPPPARVSRPALKQAARPAGRQPEKQPDKPVARRTAPAHRHRGS